MPHERRCENCQRPSNWFGNRDEETGWIGWCKVCNWKWRYGGLQHVIPFKLFDRFPENERMHIFKYLTHKDHHVDIVLTGSAQVELRHIQVQATHSVWKKILLGPPFVLKGNHTLVNADSSDSDLESDDQVLSAHNNYINSLWKTQLSKKVKWNYEIKEEEPSPLDLIIRFLGKPPSQPPPPPKKYKPAESSTYQSSASEPLEYCAIDEATALNYAKYTFYFDNKGENARKRKWKMYDIRAQIVLNACLHNGRRQAEISIDYAGKSSNYVISFEYRKQFNVDTQYERDIKWVPNKEIQEFLSRRRRTRDQENLHGRKDVMTLLNLLGVQDTALHHFELPARQRGPRRVLLQR